MTCESDACTILVNSIKTLGGMANKIPDPTGDFSSTIKRPFDIIGAFKGRPLYIEVKYISTMGRFDLQIIEDHQIEALVRYQKELPDIARGMVVWAVSVGRGDHRFYFLNDVNEVAIRRQEKRNYLQKEVAGLPYLSVKKGLVEFL